jgi:xanthine/CO dehydrogenase XdhC/CoxF family maturation factor
VTDALDLLEAARELRRGGEPFVSATVVRVLGSSYRRPGARLLVTQDRVIAGSVSGGCLEADIARKAFFKTETEPVALARYDLRVDDDLGWGLGCNGVVDVLLERVEDGRGPIACLERAIVSQRACGRAVTILGDGRVKLGASLEMADEGAIVASDLPADMSGAVASALRQALAEGATRASSIDGVEVLLEVVVPPPSLFVFGTSHDALPIVTLGKGLGWDVTVCDAAPRWTTRERFRFANAVRFGEASELARAVDVRHRAAAVILSHDYSRDRGYLRALLDSRAEYIGVLGPRRRTERMLTEIASDGWTPPARALNRLHAPVGLDLEADTPAEIALAVVAEIQACMAGASARMLRDKDGPIHLRRACA